MRYERCWVTLHFFMTLFQRCTNFFLLLLFGQSTTRPPVNPAERAWPKIISSWFESWGYSCNTARAPRACGKEGRLRKINKSERGGEIAWKAIGDKEEGKRETCALTSAANKVRKKTFNLRFGLWEVLSALPSHCKAEIEIAPSKEPARNGTPWPMSASKRPPSTSLSAATSAGMRAS